MRIFLKGNDAHFLSYKANRQIEQIEAVNMM